MQDSAQVGLSSRGFVVQGRLAGNREALDIDQTYSVLQLLQLSDGAELSELNEQVQLLTRNSNVMIRLDGNFLRDLQGAMVADISSAREGDPCPVTGQPLQVKRGIEVGNIFKLKLFRFTLNYDPYRVKF